MLERVSAWQVYRGWENKFTMELNLVHFHCRKPICYSCDEYLLRNWGRWSCCDWLIISGADGWPAADTWKETKITPISAALFFWSEQTRREKSYTVLFKSIQLVHDNSCFMQNETLKLVYDNSCSRQNKILNQCWCIAVPASQTMGRH